MFLVFTADDAIQSYTLDAVNQFLAHRQNPNGCTPKMTYYNSIDYTNFSLVTDWYVAGNEIADHTCVPFLLPALISVLTPSATQHDPRRYPAPRRGRWEPHRAQ